MICRLLVLTFIFILHVGLCVAEEHDIVLRYHSTMACRRLFSRKQQCSATQDCPDIQLLLY